MGKQSTVDKLSCNLCPFCYYFLHDKIKNIGNVCGINEELIIIQHIESKIYHPKCPLKDGLIIEFMVRDDMLSTGYSYQ